MRPLSALATFVIVMAGAAGPAGAASPKPLSVVVEVESSRGLRAGDAVTANGRRIGEVTSVGFGREDTVDLGLQIDGEHRDEVRRGGSFVAVEGTAGKRAAVEYYVIDSKSPPAKEGERFRAARSLADVWLRRGRINADELNRSLEHGLDEFRRNLEELRRSPEWPKFKDQLAALSAQFAATGLQLQQLLNDQLPKLQKELDDLYEQYQRELEKRATPKPEAPY